jgi:translation elongation factor EF-1beta
MASVEGLLSEVSPNVKLTHVINAGDQLYYGDRRLYTHVEPKVQAGKQDKTQQPTKHEEEGNPVYEAIQTAKHAVQSVLGGIAHALEPANDEVEELRKEIAELKLGQGKLRDEITELRQLVQKLSGGQATTSTKPAAAPAQTKPAPKEEPAEEEEDFDLFGSEDEEDEEQKKVREQRLADYAAKKSKKPGPIAKSSVILDVKPWDDTTDLKEMENLVRSIEQDGLLWGAAKLVPVGYGINKLQIVSTIEDAKVSVDDIIERIQDDFQDHVQSVDIVAFNKI